VRHGVFPVLIRKDDNPLLRIVVDPGTANDVRLTSLSISLEGTDDIRDVESLRIFATNDRMDFEPKTQFGEVLSPTQALQFEGDQLLARGKNVFWLSIRLKPTANLSHHVAARCLSATTSNGPITVLDETEPVGHRIGVAVRQHQEGGVHTSRIPAL